jgi:hypothetical protein
VQSSAAVAAMATMALHCNSSQRNIATMALLGRWPATRCSSWRYYNLAALLRWPTTHWSPGQRYAAAFLFFVFFFYSTTSREKEREREGEF